MQTSIQAAAIYLNATALVKKRQVNSFRAELFDAFPSDRRLQWFII